MLGTASFLTVAGATAVRAADSVEEVLITGSLIRGAAAVGVPVAAITEQDFRETGALTISDALRQLPALQVTVTNAVTQSGGTIQKPNSVAIHGLASTTGPETLLMINGMRFPIQGFSTEYVDPSVVAGLGAERIDVLAEGASATYGSDAVAGVVNVIMKRGFEGAITQFRYAQSWDIGGSNYQAAQLYGRKWDSGQVTVSYEWYHEDNVHGLARDYFTLNFEPFGFDNQTPIGASMPGVVSTGGLVTDPLLQAQGFNAATGTRACTNCYTVPSGVGWNYGDTPAHTNPLAPGSAPTTAWSNLLANKGVKSLRNPATDADIRPSQDRNAATLTVDQIVANDVGGIFRDVNVFADGFYSNRRAVFTFTPGASPAREQAVRAMPVPTTNPYYPAGAPAGLRISYNLSVEHNSRINAAEVGGRYAFGLTSELPYDWHGKIYYSMSSVVNAVHVTGMVNTNMVSAALGNTVPSVAASGNTPGQAAFTKPANIPFLNLFCDATVFQCNSPITLNYISAFRDYNEKWNIGETGINLDGPVLDLPGGTLRAAVGANALSQHYYFYQTSNFGTPNTSIIAVAPEVGLQTSWAVFAQASVPLIGENNKLPLVEALDVEVAYRYDHYYNFGAVNTPKISGTWKVGHGLSLRGTYGKAFRAPTFSETASYAAVMVQPKNPPAGEPSITFPLNCAAVSHIGTGSGKANPGSLDAYLNPTCSTDALLVGPGGISVGGGAGGAAPIRVGPAVKPEVAKNWSLGFNFAPVDFVPGLNIDFTYYHLRIEGVIAGQSPGENTNDPLAKVCTAPGTGCVYLVRANPNLPITDAANATFLSLVTAVANNPRATVPASALSNIQFIQDIAVTNLGWRQIEGTDFSVRYDFDLEDWGAWNVGIAGNYKVEDKAQRVPGLPVEDAYRGNTGGRLKYRGRLGWVGESWNVTGFVNVTPHGPVSSIVPPPCYWSTAVNPATGQPYKAGDCYAGSPFWGPYDVFPLRYPDQYTFDLSIGYQTGTTPANVYLQNINLQLTVLNLFNRRPPWNYLAQSGRGVAAFVDVVNEGQRYVTFGVTKAW